MIKAESGKKGKEPCPGLLLGKTTVLVISARPVLVTATSHIKEKGKRIKDETGKQFICMTLI